jgi:hypothetical protein
MKNVSKLAALSFSMIALIAQPAFASKAASSATAAASGEAATSSKRSAGEKQYCTNAETTGSRLPKRICLTKEQWQAEGGDISAKEK